MPTLPRGHLYKDGINKNLQLNTFPPQMTMVYGIALYRITMNVSKFGLGPWIKNCWIILAHAVFIFQTMKHLLILALLYLYFLYTKETIPWVHRIASANRTSIDMEVMSLKTELSQRLCLSPEPLPLGAQGQLIPWFFVRALALFLSYLRKKMLSKNFDGTQGIHIIFSGIERIYSLFFSCRSAC